MKQLREEGDNIVTSSSESTDVELPSEDDFIEMLKNDASNWGNQCTRPMGFYTVYHKYNRSC